MIILFPEINEVMFYWLIDLSLPTMNVIFDNPLLKMFLCFWISIKPSGTLFVTKIESPFWSTTHQTPYGGIQIWLGLEREGHVYLTSNVILGLILSMLPNFLSVYNFILTDRLPDPPRGIIVKKIFPIST